MVKSKSYECWPHQWIVRGEPAPDHLYVTADCELCDTVTTRPMADVFLSRRSLQGIRIALCMD